MEAFGSALESWNARVAVDEKKRTEDFRATLPVKGAAWLAGFPVANTMIDIPNGTVDYVGPSMDSGFRIAALSTQRKLSVAVELAFILLKLDGPLRVHFDGCVKLKGLSEDIGYPALWIEVGKSKFLSDHRELLGTGGQDSDRLRQLCENFITEFGVPNHLPFFSEDSSITPKPEGYDAKLALTVESLRKVMVPDGPSSSRAKKSSARSQALIERIPVRIRTNATNSKQRIRNLRSQAGRVSEKNRRSKGRK